MTQRFTEADALAETDAQDEEDEFADARDGDASVGIRARRFARRRCVFRDRGGSMARLTSMRLPGAMIRDVDASLLFLSGVGCAGKHAPASRNEKQPTAES